MNMGDSGARLVAPNAPCCNFDNAPVAARQRQFTQAVPTTLAAVAAPYASMLPSIDAMRRTDNEEYLSPPPLQSLLCTFLV